MPTAFLDSLAIKKKKENPTFSCSFVKQVYVLSLHLFSKYYKRTH